MENDVQWATAGVDRQLPRLPKVARAVCWVSPAAAAAAAARRWGAAARAMLKVPRTFVVYWSRTSCWLVGGVGGLVCCRGWRKRVIDTYMCVSVGVCVCVWVYAVEVVKWTQIGGM